MPGRLYQEVLDDEERPLPESLRVVSPDDGPPDEVPIEHYTSRSHYEREVEKVWRRTWQWACREDHVRDVGDTYVYEVADFSILIVRSSEDRIQAFHNVCLHRGRRLKDHVGQCGHAEELRCPFHGFCWDLDGNLKHIPSAWDFPHVEPASWELPEVQVDTWAGFVFINLDPDCPPLDETLGVVVDHFEPWRLQDRYVAMHVGRVVRCNWKVHQEAFIEGLHLLSTHPQMVPYTADQNSQIDIFGPVNRQMGAYMEPTPLLEGKLSQQEIYHYGSSSYLYDDIPPLPEGTTARRYFAQVTREYLRAVMGDDIDAYADAELTDGINYSVFPNTMLWGGMSTELQYRWYPYQNRHDMSVMEVMFLRNFRGERPRPAPFRLLEVDELWTDIEELGTYGRTQNQDQWNLEAVQRGLEMAVRPTVILAKYQESRIRHFHRLLASYMERP